MVKKDTCVFISGQGTNLKNLILRSREYGFPINIKLIITNNKHAYGIIYAKKNSIPYIIINTKLKNYENKILQILKKKKNFSYLSGRFYENNLKKFYKKIWKKNY